MHEEVELWLRSLARSKSQRTVLTYQNAVLNFLKSVGKSPLELSPSDVFLYVDNSPHGISSILTHLSAIKHFYTFLQRRGIFSKEKYSELRDAIEEVREELSPSKPLRKPKALSKQEISKILEAVVNTRYEKVYTIFLSSGVRLSEYASLKKQNFKKQSGTYWLHLPAESTKGRKERSVPIILSDKEQTYKLCEHLDVWLENFEENLSVNPGSLQVFTNRLSKKLGLGFSIHSFRHTYITNLINMGFPAEVVKELAGHSNIKTTIDIYYRFSEERVRAIVENFLS